MPEKVALVTGASSGFGLLTSIELAKAGFRVVATMRDVGRRERLDQAVATSGVSARIDVRALDVTRFETIQSFVETVVGDYGRLDVLVNNAGFAVAGFAEDIKLDELRRQFETNFFGAVAMTKAALPTMRRQHSGHIIQISSIAGLHGSVTVSSYAASKHALEGWSESLRLEVNALGIKAVLVEPGAFQTDIWTRGAVMGEQATKETSPNLRAVCACARPSKSFPKPTRSWSRSSSSRSRKIPTPSFATWRAATRNSNWR
jgi:NAD(P)-dependent dehydrogenase (short-subunit alcohol dehydrogenase family)